MNRDEFFDLMLGFCLHALVVSGARYIHWRVEPLAWIVICFVAMYYLWERDENM